MQEKTVGRPFTGVDDPRRNNKGPYKKVSIKNQALENTRKLREEYCEKAICIVKNTIEGALACNKFDLKIFYDYIFPIFFKIPKDMEDEAVNDNELLNQVMKIPQEKLLSIQTKIVNMLSEAAEESAGAKQQDKKEETQ